MPKTKNNDLDMQTFQIYQDEETDMTTVMENQPKQQEQKPKAKGLKGMFSFNKKKTGEITRKTTKPISASNSGSSNKSSGLPDSVKGLLVGVLLLIIFVVIDKFFFS